MAVTYDATGAGGTATTSPLTFTHTCAASATYLIVGVAVDIGTGDGALTASCTYNSISVPSVLRWESGGSAQSAGFTQLFAKANPSTGSAFTVSVSVTGGTPDRISGNSMSFIGAAALGTAAHGDSNAASVTSGSVTVPVTTPGNIVAITICNGQNATSWTTGTAKWTDTGAASSGAAGVSSGAILASTGGSVSPAWTQTSDFYAAVAVEVQAGGGGGGAGSSGPPLYPQNETSAPAIVVTSAGWRNAQHSL